MNAEFMGERPAPANWGEASKDDSGCAERPNGQRVCNAREKRKISEIL